ncbi:MAG: N-6 DNA methylase [Candidatus Thermoplasmatota archaeon]|jgi:type I restriction-modification system DNA methylase subunit|nr:N-6 DNA methylase [Candidatus Thermoplasmatota archaeon]
MLSGSAERKRIRSLGEHLTPSSVFTEFIMPKIEGRIYEYIWIDLFSGEGNLILPILERIPVAERAEFFSRHIYLFDIQEKMVKKSIENAISYGIPEKLAESNILAKDTLDEFPDILRRTANPVFHITNPPYLYIGYIAKQKERPGNIRYFTGENKGLQDLYQIALMNDLRNSISQMIYIIPSNFIFGHSVSNQIRRNLLSSYNIKDAIIFEKRIFENTGTNVAICFFEKTNLESDTIKFTALKINASIRKRIYTLKKDSDYRAGSYFDEYVQKNRKNLLNVNYYLKKEEIDRNTGWIAVTLLNSKEYKGGKYTKRKFFINENLYSKIRSNPVFLRSVDTGSENGKAGLYSIKEVYDADGVYVEGNTYRTNPIQVFIEPRLSEKQMNFVIGNFNKTLNRLREKTDSEFMTTYKYTNNSRYTRKYLGLNQARALLETIVP